MVNYIAPPYLNDLLPKPPDNSTYNLRNSEDQRQFSFRTTKFESSILPDSINEWNKLDNITK